MQCHTSISKTVGLLAATVLMLGASWFCTTVPQLKAQVAGWLGLSFCSLGVFVFLGNLFRRGPVVTIDDDGIHDGRAFGTIPWDEIVHLRIGEVQSQYFLCVEVRDPSSYLARLPLHKRLLAQGNPAMGFPPITIGFSGLSPGLDEVWVYLRSQHREKTG